MAYLLIFLGITVGSWPVYLVAEPQKNDVSTFLELRISQDPDDFVALNRLALVYLDQASKSGNLDLLFKARSTAQKSLQASSGKARLGALFVLGQSELQLHHFQNALDFASEILHMDPGSIPTLGLQFDALIEQGELHSAAKKFNALRSRGVQGPALWAREARLDELEGRYEQAMQKLDKASKKDSTLLIRYGEMLFKYGHLDKARNVINKALSEESSRWSALEHLAEIEGAQGHWDQAITDFESAIQLCPDRPEVYQGLGDLHAFMGNRDKAVPYYQKAKTLYEVSIREGNDHFLHHLAGFYADSDEKPAKAKDFAEKDLVLRRSAYAFDSLGWAQFKLGELEQATRNMEKALSTGLKDPHLLHHAGIIYSLSGKLYEGQDLLRQAQRINPYFLAFHMHR